MKTEKRFNNVKNMPNLDGTRQKRLSLEVDSDGVIVDKYWRNRFEEGAIEPMEESAVEPAVVEPVVSKAQTAKTQTTKPKKDDE